MGQLIAGVALGPSVLGAIWPRAQHTIFGGNSEQQAMLEAVSDLGILMLLLLTGMETDLKLVRKARRAAVSVSAAGIIVPFVFGVTLGQFLPESMQPQPEQRLVTSLFLGTALSVQLGSFKPLRPNIVFAEASTNHRTADLAVHSIRCHHFS